MIKGDICTSPVDFALQEAMKQVENAKEDHDLVIYEALKRSRKMWERIRIHGLQMCGMTYEQFCDQLNEKPNVVFMSDEEIAVFEKAVQIIKILNA